MKACQDMPLPLFFPFPGNITDLVFCWLNMMDHLRYQGNCCYESTTLMQNVSFTVDVVKHNMRNKHHWVYFF